MSVARQRIEVTCGTCAAPMEVHPSKLKAGRGKFCSVVCQRPAQIAAIRERNRDRESARISAAVHVDLPTYRLSDPRVRISRRCPSGCGDTVMAEMPEGLSPGRVVCFGMCGKTFGWVQA